MMFSERNPASNPARSFLQTTVELQYTQKFLQFKCIVVQVGLMTYHTFNTNTQVSPG